MPANYILCSLPGTYRRHNINILFNDVIQQSDAADALKSPALSDLAETRDIMDMTDGTITINLGGTRRVNCIGIGNMDGSSFTVNGHGVGFTGNGLYMLPAHDTDRLVITTDATHIGRLATGTAVRIPTSVRKEPAFCSTAEPRMTLAGQVVKGLGGYNYRTVSLDSRYKIDGNIMSEIEEGYRYTGMGYPFFINLEDEAYKLPFDKLYAIDTNQRAMGFESGVMRFLYSRRFNFRECF